MAATKERARSKNGNGKGNGARPVTGAWRPRLRWLRPLFALAREAAGLALITAGALLLLALPAAESGASRLEEFARELIGAVGTVGAVFTAGALLFFGLLLPPLNTGAGKTLRVAAGAAFGFFALLPLAALYGFDGGARGADLQALQSGWFSAPGARLFNALLLAYALFNFCNLFSGAVEISLGRVLALLKRGAAALGGSALRAVRRIPAAELMQRAQAALAAARMRRKARAAAKAEAAAAAKAEAATAESAAQTTPAAAPAPNSVTPERPAAKGEAKAAPEAGAAADAPAENAEPEIVEHPREQKGKPEQDSFSFDAAAAFGDYQAPDIAAIFEAAPKIERGYDRESLVMNSRILEKKLADFGVQGRVDTVHPGPVITMYEFAPAAGIKVSKITNLCDDLALALRALSVRIVAPIPGKSVVGIEVSNPERETVYIRELLLESKNYRRSKSKLTLALGRDIFGNPLDADLATMPHLLVAGATGTGKSVFLNSLLCSILCRAAPDEVKLLLVDPKLLELSIYEGIPHLIADVVTNPKRAAAALQGIVEKMEARYQRMAALGVRNIAQYNEHVAAALEEGKTTFQLKSAPGEAPGEEVAYERLPYIVVVIDELADLMVVSARDVEESLQRIAQMARAAGIHLVLATQRPSVDVLTGVIKANFPSRISFQVSQRIDSRTILDQAGAEQLLGMGDMLYLPPGTSKLTRVHGSFVSEREVRALVEYLRTQGRPQFDEELVRLRENEGAAEAQEEADEHYDMAVQIVAETRNASISYLQRRLKVGYNRAARMIEQMEREGVVGPQVGTKPREVFAQAAYADGEVGPG